MKNLRSIVGVLAVASAIIAVPTKIQAAPNAPVQAMMEKNPGHLKMALVNMKSLYSSSGNAEQDRKNLQTNLHRHLYFIDKAAAQGAEFVGFPEVSINGYRFNDHMIWLRLDGPELQALQQKAKEKSVYVSAGMAEEDAAGKRWNTQVLIGPDGRLIGYHHKKWLTGEGKYTAAGSDFKVFPVKGIKLGIVTCADGTDFANLQALADAGAKIVYGPHCNSTGGTTAGWYKFRSSWAGPWNETISEHPYGDGLKTPTGGWMNGLKMYAAIHNQAGLYNPDFNSPVAPENDKNLGYASGAWFIGPDGSTLAQMPMSTNKNDSKEYVLIYNVPIAVD